MTRKRASSSPVGCLIVLFILCLGMTSGVWLLETALSATHELFGFPSPALSTTDQYLYTARLYLRRSDLSQPIDPKGSSAPFMIELGESVGSIGARLEEAGMIRSAESFRWYIIYAGIDAGIQAGEYQLSPAMSAVEIAKTLQDATPGVVEFNILPGMRTEEIAALLPTSGLEIQPEVFLTRVRHPEGIDLPTGWPELNSLEGYLAPGSYHFERKITVEGLLKALTARFDQQITPDVAQGWRDQGLEWSQAVILASIIQREAVREDEQSLIASVFLNRIANGMKLDSDPTVQYALGYNVAQSTWWTNPLSGADLQVDSPYNTYLMVGLPPGPICNPGISALKAVATPENTSYLYFRARCDGSGYHRFAATYEEHLQNACP